MNQAPGRRLIHAVRVGASAEVAGIPEELQPEVDQEPERAADYPDDHERQDEA
jgi:hypothetical protein